MHEPSEALVSCSGVVAVERASMSKWVAVVYSLARSVERRLVPLRTLRPLGRQRDTIIGRIILQRQCKDLETPCAVDSGGRPSQHPYTRLEV